MSPPPDAGAPPTAAADDGNVALIARMAQGEQAALAELYDRWSSRLYSVALQVLGQPDRAEDVLEETLWQVWRGAGAYSPARKSVPTWLLTVVRRRALERLRARPRPRDAELLTEYGAPDPSFGEPEPLAPVPGAAAVFERSFRDLSDGERLALELAYFHGVPQEEIAQRLDQPLGTVRTNLRLALQKLRQDAQPVLRGGPGVG
jgi:RNA polymerase sigma-70 factor, ECF subfamily